MLCLSIQNTYAQRVNTELIDSLMGSLPETPYLIEGILDSTNYSKEKIEQLIEKISNSEKGFKFVSKEDIARIGAIKKQIDHCVDLNIGLIKSDLEHYLTLSNLLEQYKDGELLEKQLNNIDKTIDSTKNKFLQNMNSTIQFEDIYYIKFFNIDNSLPVSNYSHEFSKIIKEEAIDRNLGTSIESNTLVEDSKILYDSVEALLAGKISGSIFKNRTNYKENYVEVIYKVKVSPNYQNKYLTISETDYSDKGIEPIYFSLLSNDSTFKRNQVLDSFIDSDDVISEINNCIGTNKESDTEVKKKITSFRNDIVNLQRERIRILVEQIKRNDTLRFILRNLRVPHNPNTEVKDFEYEKCVNIVHKRRDSLENLFNRFQENKFSIKTTGNETLIDQDGRKAVALKVHDYLLKMKAKNYQDIVSERTVLINKKVESFNQFHKSETVKDFDFISFYLVAGENSNVFVYPLVKYKLRTMKSTKVQFLNKNKMDLNTNLIPTQRGKQNLLIEILGKLRDELKISKQDSMVVDSLNLRIDLFSKYNRYGQLVSNFKFSIQINKLFEEQDLLLFNIGLTENKIDTGLTDPYILNLKQQINSENIIPISFAKTDSTYNSAKILKNIFESYESGIITFRSLFAKPIDEPCCPSFKVKRKFKLNINSGQAEFIEQFLSTD